MNLGRHSRLIWLGVIALSPLAYFGSLMVERALPGHNTVAAIDEAQALRIGRQFAESIHFDIQGWEQGVGSSNNEDLEAVVHDHDVAALTQISSPVKIRLSFETA
jgi:hypothetical protein